MADEQNKEPKAAEKNEQQATEQNVEQKVTENVDTQLPTGEQAAAVEKVEVTKTGNEKVDSIGSILANKGVAEAQAILDNFKKTGEITIEHQAVILDKLGDSVGSLAITQLQETAAAARDASNKAKTELRDYAKEKFNAEDAELTWTQIQEFVRTEEAGYSEADLAAMNSMLAKGGLQARLVIDNIASTYYALESSSQPTDLLQGNVNVSGDFSPLSKSEYVSEVREAIKKHGEQSVQVQQLRRRREISRQRGF